MEQSVEFPLQSIALELFTEISFLVHLNIIKYCQLSIVVADFVSIENSEP